MGSAGQLCRQGERRRRKFSGSHRLSAKKPGNKDAFPLWQDSFLPWLWLSGVSKLLNNDYAMGMVLLLYMLLLLLLSLQMSGCKIAFCY